MCCVRCRSWSWSALAHFQVICTQTHARLRILIENTLSIAPMSCDAAIERPCVCLCRQQSTSVAQLGEGGVRFLCETRDARPANDSGDADDVFGVAREPRHTHSKCEPYACMRCGVDFISLVHPTGTCRYYYYCRRRTCRSRCHRPLSIPSP